MENNDIRLIKYCIQYMGKPQVVYDLMKDKNLNVVKSHTLKQLVQDYENNPEQITLDDILTSYRRNWSPANITLHLNNLKSNKLTAHHWHDMKPSFLHYGFQDRVRKCAAGEISLDDLLNIGKDVIAHEYFITATHDICESTIIQKFENCIPLLKPKGLSDFVFEKTPYDLKVTVYPKNWNDSNPTSLSLEKKKELAADLYTNGDSLRERLQAKNVPNWGYNRMYILVRNDEDWLNKPELLLDTLCNQLQNNYQSFPVNVGDTEIQMCLIEI